MATLSVTFQEVSDFIQANKKEFDKFEEDLNLVADWANELSKLKRQDQYTTKVKFEGSKPEFLRSYYVSDDNKKETIEFKGNTLQKNLNEIVWDFLLNHYNTVKTNKEFLLSSSDIRSQYNSLDLKDKKEATAYLASLFSIIYNHKFLSSVTINTFERFLYDNDLIIFEMDKYYPTRMQSKTLSITSSGGCSDSYFYSIKETKRENFMHIAQLLSNLQKQKGYKERGGKHSYQRESAYQALEKNDFLEKVVPQNTLQVLKKALNKDCELGIPYNLTNDFSMNVIFNAMPKKLTMDWYKKFKVNVTREPSNDKIGTHAVSFNMMCLLVKKYGYKKINDSKYIDQNDLSKLFGLNFYSNIKYTKVEELDKDYTAAYVNFTFNNAASLRGNMLDMLYACVQLSQLDNKTLEEILKQTDKSFKCMLNYITEHDEESVNQIVPLYNVKDIKSKKIFKELKKELNRFYYKEKSLEYVAFDEKIKKQIEKDSFKHALLKKTKYITARNHYSNECAEIYTHTDEILEKIAQVFALKI